MSVQRGDIVLTLYPFASGGGVKQRPVLVVQNDRDNGRLTNTIVAQITSNTRRAHEPTHLLIEVGTPEGAQSGLLADSLVSCVNLATIGINRLGRTIGHLSPPLLANVDACLRAALQL
jgi:mRNA interferase MazF